MIEKLLFDHLGVATNSIDNSLVAFEILGYKLDSEIYVDKNQDVKVCFIKKDKSPRIELIEPLSSKSPIKEIINKNRGVMPYHYCYKAINLEENIKELEKSGCIKITKETPSPAFKNKKVLFFYKQDLGIIELIEN